MCTQCTVHTNLFISLYALRVKRPKILKVDKFVDCSLLWQVVTNPETVREPWPNIRVTLDRTGDNITNRNIEEIQ